MGRARSRCNTTSAQDKVSQPPPPPLNKARFPPPCERSHSGRRGTKRRAPIVRARKRAPSQRTRGGALLLASRPASQPARPPRLPPLAGWLAGPPARRPPVSRPLCCASRCARNNGTQLLAPSVSFSAARNQSSGEKEMRPSCCWRRRHRFQSAGSARRARLAGQQSGRQTRAERPAKLARSPGREWM